MYWIVSFWMNVLLFVNSVTEDDTNSVGCVNTLFDITFCALPAANLIPWTVCSNCALTDGTPPTVALDGYKK